MRKGYEDLIQQHTNRVIFASYASYLGETGEEHIAIEQLELARVIETNNPAIWNNLANLYGHNGDVKKSFAYYAKAIELEPTEPVYYHNFGTTSGFERCERALLHQRAASVRQAPSRFTAMRSGFIQKDFKLAADVAQTFYGIQPPRTDDALRAWTNAFQLAGDDVEREGFTSILRVKWKAGRFDEARGHLNSVTNAENQDVKRRVLKSLEAEVEKRASTNAAVEVR